MASIRKRKGKNGTSYQIRASVGTDENGESIIKSMTWKPPAGMTSKKADKEAQRQAEAFEELLNKGIRTDKITFAEVAQQYIDYISDIRKPTTVMSHSERIKLINKCLGHIEIKLLNKQHIRDFISELEKPTTRKGVTKKRSAATVNDYFKTLSCVMSFACESDYIETNPCVGKGIRKPKQTTDKDRAIPIDVLQQYAEALEEAPLHDRLFFHLTLSTGMRRGEVLGLAWENIDIENCTVTIIDNCVYVRGQGIIYQTTKRKSSDRTIAIPEYVAEMLRQMKVQQAENHLKAGRLWKANPENPAEQYCENHSTCNKPCTGFCSKNCKLFKQTERVFTNELGRPTHPYTPGKNLQKIGKRAGLPPITVHALRHTAASLAIKNGDAITDIAAYLGHSSPKITMEIYAHPILERDQARSISTGNILNTLKIAK